PCRAAGRGAPRPPGAHRSDAAAARARDKPAQSEFRHPLAARLHAAGCRPPRPDLAARERLMAMKPLRIKATPPAGTADREDPLLKEMNRRVDRARADRQRHQSRIADCYKYAMPWRHKFYQTPASFNTVELDEIFDELSAVVLEDFSADMLNTFTPRKNNWLSEQPVEYLDTAAQRMIAEPLKRRVTVIFSEMARSNLYQALQEAYMDLGPGTMAMLIMDIDATKPIHCEAIP